MTILPQNTIELLIKAETDLERRIIADKDWREGVLWGEPRRGHPEGNVVFHIKDVLDNVDKVDCDSNTRERLRLVTLIHDTFKIKEDRSLPRKIERHHAVYANKFARKYIDDELVLDLILLHDNAYYAWLAHQFADKVVSDKILKPVLERFPDNDFQLYYLFFKCDTLTGDKVLEPMDWFEETFEKKISKVYW